jgi:hypothetical protein
VGASAVYLRAASRDQPPLSGVDPSPQGLRAGTKGEDLISDWVPGAFGEDKEIFCIVFG